MINIITTVQLSALVLVFCILGTIMSYDHQEPEQLLQRLRPGPAQRHLEAARLGRLEGYVMLYKSMT